MKKAIFYIIFQFLVSPTFAQDRLSDHVILVSIDGFRPDFYLEEKWPAANIKWMVERGVMSEGVRGVFPTVTYPSHTTIVTGAKPARHGIYYNSPFEPNGQTGAWYWFEKDIRWPHFGMQWARQVLNLHRLFGLFRSMRL